MQKDTETLFAVTNSTQEIELQQNNYSTKNFDYLLNCSEENVPTIIETTLADNEYFCYPQFEIIQGKNDLAQINSMIYDNITTLFDFYGLPTIPTTDIDANEDVSLSYVVHTLNDIFLSAEFTIVYYRQPMPHPRVHTFSLNIDLENKKIITLTDMVNVDLNFYQDFFNNATVIDFPGDDNEKWFMTYYPPFTQEGVETLKQCDNFDTNVNTGNIFSYYKDNKVYLCFPKAYVVGSTGIFEYSIN